MRAYGRFSIRGLAAAAIVCSGFAIAHAQDNPEEIIKYRQNVMKAQGAHITNIAAVAKGDVGYVGHVEAHARAISGLADMVVDLFPEGTETGVDTRALPAIWEDRAGFDEAAQALQDAMPALIEAAATGERAAIGGALRDVGNACKGCHDDYREEEE